MSTYQDVQALSPAVSCVPLDRAASIVRRAVEDAVTAALPGYWRRRAQTFEDARPRPGDFTGRATELDLAALDLRLARAAAACRRHADLLEGLRPWWLPGVLDDALGEVA